MIYSVMNEGAKKVTQTHEIIVWWKKLSAGKPYNTGNEFERYKVKSEIYDKILEKLPHVKRSSIRRAVNTHLGWTQQPKKIEVTA